MASKAYNPYNAYKKIVGYKGNWHTAKQLGGDPDSYYRQAMPYYKELYDNGYGELADNLASADYITAKKLRDTYGLKPDGTLGLDQAYDSITGNSSVPGSGNGNGNGSGKSWTGNAVDDELLNEAFGGNDMVSQFMRNANGLATGEITTQPSSAVQGMLDSWRSGNDRLNGEIRYDTDGNVISGLNTAHYNLGREQLDRINNFDVTKEPYYEGIMAAYRLGGQNAANNAYASGAADNGGNIDSYAAANANRQQLAFTTAGQQAALAAAQQNAANWQNLYSQMSADLANQGTINLQTLDVARQMYATDAAERMNAMDQAGSLASQQMANAITAFQTAVEERMADKQISADQAMQEADLAAMKERLELELASNERMHTQDVNLGYYQTDAEKAINAENAYTNRYMSDNTLAGTRYQADSSLAGTKYTADANRYSTDLNYQLGLAGYQNALDVARLNGEIEQQAAAADAQRQREYNQWLIDNGLTMDSKGNLVAPSGASETIDDGYSYDDIVAAVYNILTSGTPVELAGVTDWDSLKTYIYNASNGTKDWKTIEAQVDKWKKNLPDLLDNYFTNLGSASGNAAQSKPDVSAEAWYNRKANSFRNAVNAVSK